MLSKGLSNDHSPRQANWRPLYQNHLAQSLAKTIDYVKTSGVSSVRSHIISMLTLLEESLFYRDLKELRLSLINELHPLPLRSGLSYRWEARMLEVINEPAYKMFQNQYLIDLAEIYLFSGQMPRAIEVTDKVLNAQTISKLDAANAVRTQFISYRTLAKPEKADMVYREYGTKFGLFLDPDNYTGNDLKAWMKSHLTELEILRENGKTDEALSLVNKMISIDEKLENYVISLSAELHVHRSTLLWVKARYPQAIRDLEKAITLYLKEEDVFNAESLKSNLGLIYWTMGELSNAEKYLSEAILFYQNCGADQLMAYDIGNLGLVYFAQGNLEMAKQKTLEHIRHSDRIGFTTESYRGHTNLGDILYYFGQFEDAIAEHELVDDYFEARGSREGYGLGKVWVACCRAKLGDIDSAVTELNEILIWCSHHQSRVLEALTHRALAQWLPVPEGESHLRQSLNLAREQGRQLEEAASLLMLARVLEDRDLRNETWSSGVQILERIGATSWLLGASIDNPPFIAMFV